MGVEDHIRITPAAGLTGAAPPASCCLQILRPWPEDMEIDKGLVPSSGRRH